MTKADRRFVDAHVERSKHVSRFYPVKTMPGVFFRPIDGAIRLSRSLLKKAIKAGLIEKAKS